MLPALLRRLLNPHPAPTLSIILPQTDDPRPLQAALDYRPPRTPILLITSQPQPRRKRVRTIPLHHPIDCTTPYLLALAPGVLITPTTIPRLLAELQSHPETDLLYADEDHLTPENHLHDPYRKPAWSLDLALEQDLIGALCLTRTPAIQIDLKSPLTDLALETGPKHIRHIPEILAHRTTPRPKTPTPAIVQQALPPGTTLLPSRFDSTRLRPAWPITTPAPRVSVIIPTRDNPTHLARATQGLLHQTDYPDLELLIVDNGSTHPDTLALLAHLRTDPRTRILSAPGPFNYAALNNNAAAQASGPVLLLLNDDVEILHPAWLQEMTAHALRPTIGAVGARLLFPNKTIQHAGIVGGVGRFDDGPGIAGHYGYTAPASEPGPHDQFILTRELLAVTAACLAIRRDLYLEMGGLDAEHLPIALNDLDLCLRLRAAGYRILWTPFAELRHHESASRGPDTTPNAAARFHRECRTIRNRWGAVLDADPFYNPAYSRFDHSFQATSPLPSRATGVTPRHE